MAVTKPVILIVHGAFFLPSVWSPFVSLLEAAGFDSHCPHLPTCGDNRPPRKTIKDDIDAIRNAAIGLVSAGKKVIVLVHSYGAVPTSEAIDPSLYASNTRNGAGVIHIIYISSWVLPKASSIASILERNDFPSRVDVGFNEDGTTYAKNATESLYNDVQPRSRAEELAKQNVTYNWSAVGESVQGVPWMDLPTTYVHCKKDQAILLEMQAILVGNVREALRDKNLMTTETLDAGHCPFLSVPDTVLNIVTKVADGL